MNTKDKITALIDELQDGVRELIAMPGRVTIGTEAYRNFFDKVQSFVGRYDLVKTEEWKSVDKWLIRKPNEFLTLEEAGHLKLALEKLRLMAIECAETPLTENEKTDSDRRTEEHFLELSQIGSEQIQLLNEQNEILKASGKTAKWWYWIMFAIALAGVVAAFVQAFK